MIKRKKGAGICGNIKKKATQEKTVQPKEINTKLLAKEGRLKRYQQRVNNTEKTQDIPKQQKKILSTTGRA